MVMLVAKGWKEVKKSGISGVSAVQAVCVNR